MSLRLAVLILVLMGMSENAKLKNKLDSNGSVAPQWKIKQVYSAGELLAPIYLWSAAVALSLLGQACEYSEESSTVSVI